MKATSPKKKTPVKAEVQENEILLRQMTAEQNSGKKKGRKRKSAAKYFSECASCHCYF